MRVPVTDGPDHTSTPNYGDMTMPIAVVGMACRLPGEASNPEGLWEILAQQRDVWTTTPSDRFNHDLYYHPDPSRNGTVRFPSSCTYSAAQCS
jgi:acyl transferase domain-containing protein